MQLDLEGKRVLITGASKGIGLATAWAFAKEGCELYLAARSLDQLEKNREEILRKHKTRVTVCAADMGSSADIKKLAELPHVNVKLGGLAMAFCNFPSFMANPPASSAQLAADWKPYLETCIEAFGPSRCMFESNFPVDLGSCDYPTLWNAFKVFAKGYSAAEKADLFAGTAKRVYRLDLPN